MANLGFVGLGIMGGPMAQHLIDAGHTVALWSFTAGKAAGLRGGVACETPAEVARRSEVSFVCVGDTGMAEEVILGIGGGVGGLLEGAARGSAIADCSTIAPAASKRMAALLGERGVDFLDAPCTGSKAGAEGGKLTFMVGGPEAVFGRVRPYLEAMGTLIYHCGAHGMGLHAKLSQNMILGNLLQAFNESMVLSTKAGVDPRLMLEILDNSAAKSAFIGAKAPLVLARNFRTNFSVKWLEKDMGLMLDSAAEQNVPVPVTAISRQMLRAAMAKGLGEEDICGSIRLLEDFAGVEVKAGG